MAGLTFNIFGNDVSASSSLHRFEGTAGRSAEKIGGHFKKLGGMLAGAFAGVAVGSFLKDSIDEATEAQKVGAQTTAVLKSTGSEAGITATQIGNLATAISNKAGIDDEAIQTGENLLLTFTNLKNGAGAGNDIFNQTTQIMTDMSVATGTSMKSSALQLGKALNDPIKGVTKLSKVGVSFTDQQKDQIAALVKTGDTMGAQRVILGELNKEFGGSAAAQATPAEKASVAWGNLKETLGTYLLPVLAKVANFITTNVVPAILSMVAWIQGHWPQIKAVAANVFGFVRTVLQAVADFIRNVVIPAVQSMVQWIVAHWPQIQAVLAQVWNAVRPVLAAFRDYLMTVWDSVIKPLVAWVQAHWPTISAVIKGVFIAIAIAAKIVMVALQVSFRLMAAGVRFLAATFRIGWSVISTIYGWIKAGIGVVAAVVRTYVGIISAVWRTVGNGLRWVWNNVLSPVFGWIKGGIRIVSSVVGRIAGAVSGAFRGIGDGLKWAWDHTVGPIFGWIKSALAEVKTAYDWLFGSGGKSKLASIDRGALNDLSGNQGLQNIGAAGTPQSPPAGRNAQGTGYFGGGWTALNEQGLEVVHLPRGSRIDTASMAASAMGNRGAGQPVVVEVTVQGALSTNREIAAAVVEAFEVGVNQGRTVTAPRNAIRTR